VILSVKSVVGVDEVDWFGGELIAKQVDDGATCVAVMLSAILVSWLRLVIVVPAHTACTSGGSDLRKKHVSTSLSEPFVMFG